MKFTVIFNYCISQGIVGTCVYTVVIRYNTIGGVHKYESCYKPIVLYEMARFYLVLLDTIWLEIHGMQ